MKWYQKIKARIVSPAGERIKEGGFTKRTVKSQTCTILNLK